MIYYYYYQFHYHQPSEAYQYHTTTSTTSRNMSCRATISVSLMKMITLVQRKYQVCMYTPKLSVSSFNYSLTEFVVWKWIKMKWFIHRSSWLKLNELNWTTTTTPVPIHTNYHTTRTTIFSPICIWKFEILEQHNRLPVSNHHTFDCLHLSTTLVNVVSTFLSELLNKQNLLLILKQSHSDKFRMIQ